MVNQERWIATDKNPLLYKVTEVLDRYDLGGTASTQPGEYVVEAREVLTVAENRGRDITGGDILEIIVRQFNLTHKPLIRIRYSKAAKEINSILKGSS